MLADCRKYGRNVKWRVLAKDLAASFDAHQWMAWINQPLGSVQHESPGVADVVVFRKTYDPVVRIYEVKMSRNDFLSDVNAGKYQRYLKHCHQLFFAAPSGVLAAADIPEGVGLTVRGPSSWRVIKSAPRHDCEVSTSFLLALLMKGYEDHCTVIRPLKEKKELLEYVSLRKASVDFGAKVGRDIADAQSFLEEARSLQPRIEEVLGTKFGSLDNAAFHLRSEVEALLKQHRFASELPEVLAIADAMTKGKGWASDDVPDRLRRVADKIEKKGGVP